MALLYILSFCRIVIGLVFAISAVSKAMNFPEFVRAIIQFDILPKRLTRKGLATIIAMLFLGSEFAVVALIITSDALLWFGFVLSIVLLLTFSIALLFVLIRKIETSCSCFGPTIKLVSVYDLWRNAGFIVCALGGLLATLNGDQGSVTLVEWALLGVMATIFVSIWLQIGEIVQLFRSV